MIVLTASMAYGAVGNLQVRGVTSTQAILAYRAPDTNPCSVEVSESLSYRPLAHDVDPALFAGSNLDTREATAGSLQRVFVAGRRKAERGINGKWYSRALQAFTTHYFRITCGGSQAAGSFLTANIALGHTYDEALPADPAVSTRPYFSATGSYAWPDFTNWDRSNVTARPESVIDPQTGMLLKRLALPQDQPITYSPGGGDHDFTAAIDSASAWGSPAAAIENDTTSATFTGVTSGMLFLRDAAFWLSGGTNLSDLTLPTEFLTLSVKAWCSGTCAGEDAKIQACLSINGVTCWPTNATAKFQEVALGTTSLPSTFSVLGTTVPILDAWTPPGFAPLTRADLSERQGLVDVDANGVATWKLGGNPNTYFSPNWVVGSRITIAGSECRITARTGITTLTINPASCVPALSVPLTGAAYSGASFGFLVRKKTSSTDTINIQYAKYTSGTSQYMDFTASGSSKLCSDTLTLNTVTGGLGYHCVMVSGYPLLYWIDHVTGDANYLGTFTLPGQAGTDGWAGGVGSGSFVGTTPSAPEHFYTSATDNAGKKIILSCTLTSTNQPGNATIACTNMTPGSTGKDINALATAFTASDTPAFDSSVFSLGVAGQQGTKVIIGAARGSQDTVAWTMVFDPDKVDTAPGCVGGGAPGCVIAAQSTWGTSPARWCVSHTRFNAGNSTQMWIAGKYMSDQGTPGDGPYTSAVAAASTEMPASPHIAAGSGVCPAGSRGCDVITVDGEPCDPSPRGGENAGSYVCPKNAAKAFLQNAAVGDVAKIEGEFVRLLAKSGTSWTVQRGYGYTGSAISPPGPISHSNGATLDFQCMARDFSNNGVYTWDWTWDTATDPHATNSAGTTVVNTFPYDHVNPRPDVTVGGTPSSDPACGNCYGVRDDGGSLGDAPNKYVTYAPTFAGKSGPTAFLERAQNHPGWLQDSAPAAEKKWFIDGRPLKALMDISDSAVAVSGQLYRVTSTTLDGDNLSKIGSNIYVVREAPATLVAGGNCSAGSPCPIWRDTTLVEAITTPCTITLNSGTGSVFVHRQAAGGLGVIYTSGLSISTDTCTATVGTNYPIAYDTWRLWTWTSTAGVWAVSGTDMRHDSSGSLGVINRKIQATWASCGTQALIDVSSAVTGDVLGDTSSDAYKYCVARKAGECRSGSLPGDIYANCPNVVKRSGVSYGCSWWNENNDSGGDVCVGNMSAYLNSIVQVGFAATDLVGALGRSLTKGLGRNKLMDDYFHGKALSDASWMFFRSLYTGGAWTDVLLGKLPPYPPVDSVVRATFEAIPVKLTPPAGLAVNNAVIQFGYAENGGPGQFYCTSRQEKCLATAVVVPAVQFLFPSDGTGGTETGVTGLPCANGCSIAIPAISQRVLYYQVKYRDASNGTLATGQIEAVAIP
ncbi:MAG: hypothetical protein NTW28_16575 [Candidatus Solibacter sp.]|nr:hypothetical protein [Candidatus Solibacter sp.]